MPLPTDIRVIIRAADEAARAYLTRAEGGVTEGAAEAARAVGDWTSRFGELTAKWASGGITTETFRRAVQSENEALPLNLAAITNETRRRLLSDLLESSMAFLLKLLRGAP